MGECYQLYSPEINYTACALNYSTWGNWVEIVMYTQCLFQWKSGDHDYHLLLLLMSLLIRDVAELEEMSFWEPDKILPCSALLACKEVELIECILPSL
jgi:hypothetical protein